MRPMNDDSQTDTPGNAPRDFVPVDDDPPAPPSSSQSDTARRPCMSDEACELARIGFRVCPVHEYVDGKCTCDMGAACLSPAKHPWPLQWEKLSTREVSTVELWWKRWPDANIGIATGKGSGVVVIDVDGAVGAASLAALEEKHGPIGATWRVKTARGEHIYVAHPGGDMRVANSAGNRGGVAPGIDIRGDGGFVVAPPSMHASGVRYQWLTAPESSPLAAMPAWVVGPRAAQQPSAAGDDTARDYARSSGWARKALEGEIAKVVAATEGGRNDQLNHSAFRLGQLVAGGVLDVSVVRSELMRAGIAVGLSGDEIRKTIESGLRGGLRDPRSGPHRDDDNSYASSEPPPSASPGSNGHASGAGASASSSSASPKAASGPRIEWVDTAKIFEELYPQRWVARGLQIGPGRPTLVAGYGASAKTLTAQQLALSKAAGRPIWNHFECDPGIVLHLDYEQGHYASAKRYQRLALGHKIEASELGGRLRYAELPRVMLDHKSAYDALMAACEGVELCILDSLKASSPNTEENDSKMRTTLDLLNVVSSRGGCAFMVLHHAGKPKEGGSSDARTLARGSSAIFDACGCVFNFIAGSTGADPRRVEQVKTPAEAEGAPIGKFEILVEDVALDGNATAGVRTIWRGLQPVDHGGRAAATYEADAQRLLAVLRANASGLSSNALVMKSGMNRGRCLSVLGLMLEEARLVCLTGPNRQKTYRVGVAS